jgi:hypothetical protein
LDGTDPDGWIRKAEKFFKMVSVPNEDRVKIAMMYMNGRAKYWWRGSSCNSSMLPWHHFCRIIGDRFNEMSTYEVICQFHNLKQTSSVNDYIDKFEEFMGLVKRDNPSLQEDYFVCSFVSGFKDYIHIICNAINLPRYIMPSGLPRD